MNQYVRKIEIGTNLPLKLHTASMKDWIKMLQHNYQVFETAGKAIDVSINSLSQIQLMVSLETPLFIWNITLRNQCAS